MEEEKTTKRNIFLYGLKGNLRDYLKSEYAENLLEMPIPEFWVKTAWRMKKKMTPKSVFMWNFFEHICTSVPYRFESMNRNYPGHMNIIVSEKPPEWYSEEIRTFLEKKKFIFMRLKEKTNIN